MNHIMRLEFKLKMIPNIKQNLIPCYIYSSTAFFGIFIYVNSECLYSLFYSMGCKSWIYVYPKNFSRKCRNILVKYFSKQYAMILASIPHFYIFANWMHKLMVWTLSRQYRYLYEQYQCFPSTHIMNSPSFPDIYTRK